MGSVFIDTVNVAFSNLVVSECSGRLGDSGETRLPLIFIMALVILYVEALLVTNLTDYV